MSDDHVDDENVRRNYALDALGKLIDGIVVQECVRHYDALTQEHQAGCAILSNCIRAAARYLPTSPQTIT
jgi:hypothetical protein